MITFQQIVEVEKGMVGTLRIVASWDRRAGNLGTHCLRSPFEVSKLNEAVGHSLGVRRESESRLVWKPRPCGVLSRETVFLAWTC